MMYFATLGKIYEVGRLVQLRDTESRSTMSLFRWQRSSSSSSTSRSAIKTSSSSLSASWNVIVLSSSVGLAAWGKEYFMVLVLDIVKWGKSICTFPYICICWDIKGLKNIIWTRKISTLWHVYSSYLDQNGYKSTRHTFTWLIWSINRTLGLPHACIMRAKISVIFLSNPKYGFLSVVLFIISLLLKQNLTCLSHM